MSRAIALVLLALMSPLSAADDWLMPGLSSQWIARDMDLNGVPTAMRAISGPQSLGDVLAYYRRNWAGAVDERKQGEWIVLATRQRDQFASLRVRRHGSGVQGVFTTSVDPKLTTPSLESRLPVPHGLIRLSHQAFRDDGSRGENLTLMSPRSVAYERQALVSLYANEGWIIAEDRTTRTVPDGHVLQLLRGKEQIRAVLYRDPALAQGRTLILITAHSD